MKQINRNRILWGLLSLMVLFFGVNLNVYAVEGSGHIESEISSSPYVVGEVIVKFKKDRINLDSTFSLSSQLRKLIFQWTNNYETEDTIKSGNILVLKLKEGQQINEVLISLNANPNVEYAEPNYYRQPTALNINDTYKNNLWGLDNSGQTITLSNGVTAIGTSGADIDLSRAWNLSTGTSEVIVAVIDSGVAYNHPDLVGNMWDGTNCKDENGDALGGCLHGYDYYKTSGGDKDPLSTDSTHGTHVAGIIAATQNNSKGVAGLGPKIKIMALKYGFDTISEVKAIDFAIQNGAKIINASFAGIFDSSSELDAINRFRTAGGIFVAAAGNESTDNEITHSYPSDYDLDNIISVAATNQNDELADFSNYGVTLVDVAAPGVNIYSTVVDEAAVIDYNFDDLSQGSLPTNWISDLGSSWGALNIINKEIWSDYYNKPYPGGVNSVLTADPIDLSLATSARFEFYVGCDTETTDPYGIGSSSSDYMALEVSGDGTTFEEIIRWNEYSLENDGWSSSEIDGFRDKLDVGVSAAYLTNSFRYRLRWVADNDSDYGTKGNGCFVDDFKILAYTDGSDELYGFNSGTSMAAPHVAGLAGYLWSVKPSATASEIISNILDNGDTLSSLTGKLVTGKRINAYKSLIGLGVINLTGPTVTGLTNDSVPTKSKTWTWSSDNPSTDQYRFSIDQSISGVPTGSYGVGTTVTYSSGSGTFYIHVQAIGENSAEGPVSTASFILDNSGPVATISSSSSNLFTLSFGETIYSNVGTTFTLGSDFSARFTTTLEIGISEAVSGNQTITIGVTGTSLAGSKVSLVSGAANNFYDAAGNAGGTLAMVYDGNGSWWLNPTNLSVAVTYFPDLITTEQLTVGGSASDTASSITVEENNLTITIGSLGTNSSIGLTLGTIITELTDQVFNANLITGTIIDVATISGLDVGYTAQGAIQWGIVGTTLKFNQPITIRIYLGAAYDAQTMNVYRSSSLSTGWTSTGLSTSTCVVSGGYCAFAATEASYFLAASSIMTPTPTPSSTPTPTSGLTPTLTPTSTPNNNNNNNNQSSSSNNNEGPKCNDRIPLLVPDLFRISTTKGSAKIIYTPVNEKITGYAVMYGLKKGDERYAALISPINNNQGEQSFTVNKLNPKVTYYFKVTAFNGCVSGPWSDWVPAKADRKREVHKYKTVIKNKIRTLINKFI